MAEKNAAALEQDQAVIEANAEEVVTPQGVTVEIAGNESQPVVLDASIDIVDTGTIGEATKQTLKESDPPHVTSEIAVLADAEPVKDDNETIVDVKAEETKEEEPVYSGLLSYKKASATFPIYHKRHFYFSNEAVPLDRLYAFYEKYKKLKVDKDELDHLVAHAATSGVGLFFFSKTPDAVPSGILECSRMIEIKADEHMNDKFSISYGPKQVFYFETGLSSRDAWIAGVSRKKVETAAEIESIRTSASYIANLKALEDGTAFHKVKESDSTAHDLFSDDETPVPTSKEVCNHDGSSLTGEQPMEQHKKHTAVIQKPSDGRQTPDKCLAESPVEQLKVLEKNSKKEKRRSFLAGFLSKKDASINLLPANDELHPVEGVSAQIAQTQTSESAAPATIAETPDIAGSTRMNTGSPKSPLSPLKEKVDGFFSRFKKNSDKNGFVHADTNVEASTTNMTEEIAALPAAAEVLDSATAERTQTVDGESTKNTPAVSVDQSDVTSGITGPADQEVTQPETRAEFEVEVVDIVETQITDKRPNTLTRRLTSLFKGKKQAKQQSSASSAVTSQGPPQLPETAKIEPEPQSAGGTTAAAAAAEIVKQTTIEVPEKKDTTTETHVATTVVDADEVRNAALTSPSA